MAKSTFAETEDQAAEVATTEESGALIQQPGGGELSSPTQENLNEAGLVGDWGREDVNLPRLNIVAKTSQLVDDGFTPGAIVLNKEVELVGKDTPLGVIVLNSVKQWQEDRPWEDETPAKIFNSEQELEEAGYSTEWGSPNLCRPMAHITMLVEKPEKLKLNEVAQELFPYKCGDKEYALAVFTAAKSAFKPTAKKLATYAAFARGAGIWTATWTFVSKLQTKGDVSWFGPVMERAGKTSKELLTLIEDVR